MYFDLVQHEISRPLPLMMKHSTCLQVHSTVYYKTQVVTHHTGTYIVQWNARQQTRAGRKTQIQGREGTRKDTYTKRVRARDGRKGIRRLTIKTRRDRQAPTTYNKELSHPCANWALLIPANIELPRKDQFFYQQLGYTRLSNRV